MKETVISLDKTVEPDTVFKHDIEREFNILSNESQKLASIFHYTESGVINRTAFLVYYDNEELINQIVNAGESNRKLTLAEAQFEGLTVNKGYPDEQRVNELDNDLQSELGIDTTTEQFTPPDDTYKNWHQYLINGVRSIPLRKWECVHDNDSEIVEIGEKCSKDHTYETSPESYDGAKLFNITEYTEGTS